MIMTILALAIIIPALYLGYEYLDEQEKDDED